MSGIFRKPSAQNAKVSPNLVSKIDLLPHGAIVRAILLIDNHDDLPSTSGNKMRYPRRSLTAAVSRSQKGVLTKLDGILKQYGGQRLSERPNILGGIVVETTSAGVLALADSKYVRAIFEDQPIVHVR
jgi:hypothetical protein